VDVLVEEPCRCLFCLKIDGFLSSNAVHAVPVPPGKPFMKSFSDDVVRSGFPSRYEVVCDIRGVPNECSKRFYRSPNRFVTVNRIKCFMRDPISNTVPVQLQGFNLKGLRRNP